MVAVLPEEEALEGRRMDEGGLMVVKGANGGNTLGF